ncbi:MAG: sugar-binding transcriptional regulator [Pseudomonadota bacterium]|nr:sugar-binding transcriptional regulator [Pseudomonadota bacterium]
MAVARSAFDEDADLCIRAAWLHYGAGLTQGEVAARLGVPNVKAHRLIARANKLGLVRVTIDGAIGQCVALEERLTSEFGLGFCQVAPDLDDEPLPLRALSLVGARYLSLALQSGEHAVIGFGHGRTLAACAAALPRLSAPNVKLVSLLGGLTRRFATTPFDVIHRLVERTGAEAYVLPLPFYANTIEDRAVLLDQRGVRPVVEMGVAATLRLVGIGTMEGDASMLQTGMVEREEFEEARRAGGVGEILGHIFSSRGERVESELSARTLSMPAEDIGRNKTVAIAGGRSKIEPIRAVLASGLIHGLITDERTAQALLAGQAGRKTRRKTQGKPNGENE